MSSREWKGNNFCDLGKQFVRALLDSDVGIGSKGHDIDDILLSYLCTSSSDKQRKLLRLWDVRLSESSTTILAFTILLKPPCSFYTFCRRKWQNYQLRSLWIYRQLSTKIFGDSWTGRMLAEFWHTLYPLAWKVDPGRSQESVIYGTMFLLYLQMIFVSCTIFTGNLPVNMQTRFDPLSLITTKHLHSPTQFIKKKKHGERERVDLVRVLIEAYLSISPLNTVSYCSASESRSFAGEEYNV